MTTMKKYSVSAKGLKGFVIETISGNHKVVVDQPQMMGGEDEGPSPVDFILIAWVSCLATVAKIIARQEQIDLKNIEVMAEGELDLDVLRGMNMDDRSGFEKVDINIKLDADLTQDKKKEFIKEIERRCPVTDNISNKTSFKINLVD